MKKLLPILLIMIGIGSGIGAGLYLRPDSEELVTENPCGTDPSLHAAEKTAAREPGTSNREYVKLTNQFVVPVVQNEVVTSLVLISLSLEVGTGDREAIFAREPKLRDALLQVMFDHANAGGFRGAFTNSSKLDVLRDTLSDVAHNVSDKRVSGVLITDIARQDV
ncbi:flagellar basal body-associated protein FliL [Shimia sp.]|uniref:flagellar basal body-associated protein FliL n=1 Tax=Shimia sp. TaxID=1954381 RepID=UPI0032969104